MQEKSVKALHQKVLNARKVLTKFEMKDLQMTGQGKLFLNQSLCPYCRILWPKSDFLHKMGKTFSYYVSNGTVKIKIQETSQPPSIMHTSDLGKFFPGVDLMTTVRWWDCFALVPPEENLRSVRLLERYSLW